MMLEFLRLPAIDPMEGMVATFGRIGSRERTAQDDEDVRVAVRRAMGRASADDSGRQLAAILNERDRRADLAGLAMPALVIHGDRDRIIQPSVAGRRPRRFLERNFSRSPAWVTTWRRWTWTAVIDGIERTVHRCG